MDTCGMHSTCLSSSRNSVKTRNLKGNEGMEGKANIEGGSHQAHLSSTCNASFDSLLPYNL